MLIIITTVIVVLAATTVIILIFYALTTFGALLEKDALWFIKVINIRHFKDNIITILIHHLVGEIIDITNYKEYW